MAQVRYHSHLADLTGCRQEALEGVTVAKLLDQIKRGRTVWRPPLYWWSGLGDWADRCSTPWPGPGWDGWWWWMGIPCP